MTNTTIIRALELISSDDIMAAQAVLRNMNQQLGHPIPPEVIPQQSRMDTFARLAVECDTDDELLDLFTEAATGHLIHPAPTRADLEATYGDDPESCRGCGCVPGDGVTPGCDHPDGCGAVQVTTVPPSTYTPGSVAAYARKRFGEHVEQDEVVNGRGTRHTWRDLNGLQVDTNCGSDCRAAIDRTVLELRNNDPNWFGFVDTFDTTGPRMVRADLLEDCLVFWLG
jgi:hypothetical protein